MFSTVILWILCANQVSGHKYTDTEYMDVSRQCISFPKKIFFCHSNHLVRVTERIWSGLIQKKSNLRRVYLPLNKTSLLQTLTKVHFLPKPNHTHGTVGSNSGLGCDSHMLCTSSCKGNCKVSFQIQKSIRPETHLIRFSSIWEDLIVADLVYNCRIVCI